MPLVDEIRGLEIRALADLKAAHDYYADTKIAWDLVQELIASGHTFSVRNLLTNTVTTESDLAGKSPGYIAIQLTEATFQQFVAILEYFLIDLLRLWLLAYPKSLAAKTVELRQILEAPDIAAIVRAVVDQELNQVAFKPPREWFAYLESKVGLGCPSQGEIDQIAEIKASRDILVHNNSVANGIYEAKAGQLARYKDGQRIDIPEQYHRQTWTLFSKVIAEMSAAAIAKA